MANLQVSRLITVSMPSGVEHRVPALALGVSAELITVSMPSGVEHHHLARNAIGRRR